MKPAPSVANVVGTGSFTIPMMKKLGYKPEFAGAVERHRLHRRAADAAHHGRRGLLDGRVHQHPVRAVIGVAALPALLYYFGVWAGVHFEAKKLGLKGLKREDLPKFKKIILERGHLHAILKRPVVPAARYSAFL